jgi:hypothetical protein
LTSITFVGWRTYALWNSESWELPKSAGVKPIFVAAERPVQNRPNPSLGTEIIISKNLFDPERGAGATRETEANSRALQRIKSLVLIGTVILGNDRVAIVQDSGPAAPGTPASSRSAVPVRMKVGDSIEGFKLAEVEDKKAVFSNGASQVEVLLNYFRKVELATARGQVSAQPRVPAQVGTPGAVAPRVIPNLPRRERVPPPPNP